MGTTEQKQNAKNCSSYRNGCCTFVHSSYPCSMEDTGHCKYNNFSHKDARYCIENMGGACLLFGGSCSMQDDGYCIHGHV